MRKTVKRTLSLLLAIVLAMAVLPFSGSAQQLPDTTTDTQAATALQPAASAEVVALREENAKHFDMGNGTFQAIAYSHPVHELDENGQWQDIDFSLSLSQTRGVSTYENKAAGVSFPTTYTQGQPILSLFGEGNSIEMTFLAPAAAVKRGASATSAARVSNPTNTFRTIQEASEATFSSTLVYEDVLPDVDFEYIVEPDGVKENIVVNTRKSSYCYEFCLQLENLVPELEPEGSVAIFDPATGELRYAIPAPIMYDGAYTVSEAVRYQLSGSDGNYTLTVIADEEWINAEERVFPVKIDPSLVSGTVYDACIFQDEPDTPRYLTSTLWVRFDRISYLRAPNMNLPAGATLDWATLEMYYYYNDNISSGQLTVGAYQIMNNWSAAVLTWNNASNNPNMGIATTPLSTAVTYGNVGATINSPHKAAFNITNAARAWTTGTANNYGIALKYVSGPNKSVIFKSFESGYEYRPRIIYAYSISHYFNALVSVYGFDMDVAESIIDFYNRIDRAYPNDGVIQKSWRATGVLAAFNYPTLESTYESNHKVFWDQILGNVYSDMQEKAFFLQKLGYSEAEYENLRDKIREQHGDSYATSFGDFVHMQASLSARLADYLNTNEIGAQLAGAFVAEDISYLAGWLGDCVIGDGSAPSLKSDDYISDLDAENIYRMIIQGQDIISAASSYYDSVLNHSNRAVVFKSYIDYETAKNKIYYYLIDIGLITQIEFARQNGDILLELYYLDCLNSEEYHQNELETKYQDTYDFLQALLESRAMLIE